MGPMMEAAGEQTMRGGISCGGMIPYVETLVIDNKLLGKSDACLLDQWKALDQQAELSKSALMIGTSLLGAGSAAAAGKAATQGCMKAAVTVAATGGASGGLISAACSTKVEHGR